jgi:hypothetical protein
LGDALVECGRDCILQENRLEAFLEPFPYAKFLLTGETLFEMPAD